MKNLNNQTMENLKAELLLEYTQYSEENLIGNDTDLCNEVVENYSGSTYICDAIIETADNNIEFCNYKLWENAQEIQDYIEDYVEECGFNPKNFSMISLFQCGEGQYYNSRLSENLDEIIYNYMVKIFNETINDFEDFMKENFEEVKKENFERILEKLADHDLYDDIEEESSNDFNNNTFADLEEAVKEILKEKVDGIIEEIEEEKEEEEKLNKEIEKETIENFNEFLDIIEFNLLYNKKEEKFQLEDLQGGNLGGIEKEKFNNLSEIMNRLGAYVNDYFVNDVEEQLEKNFNSEKELLEYLKENDTDIFQFEIDVLDMYVNTENYKCLENKEKILQYAKYETIED